GPRLVDERVRQIQLNGDTHVWWYPGQTFIWQQSQCIPTAGTGSNADSPARKRRATGIFQQPCAERVVPFQSRENFPKPTGNFQSNLQNKMAAEPASVNGGLLPTRGGAR